MNASRPTVFFMLLPFAFSLVASVADVSVCAGVDGTACTGEGDESSLLQAKVEVLGEMVTENTIRELLKQAGTAADKIAKVLDGIRKAKVQAKVAVETAVAEEIVATAKKTEAVDIAKKAANEAQAAKDTRVQSDKTAANHKKAAQDQVKKSKASRAVAKKAADDAKAFMKTATDLKAAADKAAKDTAGQVKLSTAATKLANDKAKVAKEKKATASAMQKKAATATSEKKTAETHAEAEKVQLEEASALQKLSEKASAAAAALVASAKAPMTWSQSSGGVTCDDQCHRLGTTCVEGQMPTTEVAMAAISEAAGLECKQYKKRADLFVHYRMEGKSKMCYYGGNHGCNRKYGSWKRLCACKGAPKA